MSNEIVIDNYVLDDLTQGNPYARRLIHGAIGGQGLRVWIPRYVFVELLDSNDAIAALLMGLEQMFPGRLMTGLDGPAYLRAIRNFAEPIHIKDPFVVATAFDAAGLKAPIVTSNPESYSWLNDVEVSWLNDVEVYSYGS